MEAGWSSQAFQEVSERFYGLHKLSCEHHYSSRRFHRHFKPSQGIASSWEFRELHWLVKPLKRASGRCQGVSKAFQCILGRLKAFLKGFRRLPSIPVRLRAFQVVFMVPGSFTGFQVSFREISGGFEGVSR